MSFCLWYPSLSSSCLLLNALMMNFLLALADCTPTGWLRNQCIILVTCKLLIIGTPSLSGMTTTSGSSDHSTVADGSMLTAAMTQQCRGAGPCAVSTIGKALSFIEIQCQDGKKGWQD